MKEICHDCHREIPYHEGIVRLRDSRPRVVCRDRTGCDASRGVRDAVSKIEFRPVEIAGVAPIITAS